MATRRDALAPLRRSASRASSSGVAGGDLPAWARLQVPRGWGGGSGGGCGPRAEDALPLPEEEAYLRTMTYHEAARRIDGVVRETLRELGEDTLRNMEALMIRPRTTEVEVTRQNGTKPTCNEDYNDEAADLDEHDTLNGNDTAAEFDAFDDSWARCFSSSRENGAVSRVESATNLRLLPVLLLEAPYHPLDAHEWMQHIVQTSQERFKRTCVVWMRQIPAHHTSSVGSTSTTDTSSLSLYIQELTRQCLWQEHEREESSKQPRPPALSPKELRRSTHCAELLRLWAARTRHFDDILVMLSPDGGAGAAGLLCWAEEQRRRHGLPLHVVALHGAATTAVGSDALAEALQRDQAFRVRRSSLPSTQAVLTDVWVRLYVDRGFGFHWSNTELEAVRQGFEQAHGSFVHLLMQLKASLAQLLAANIGLGVMSLAKGSAALAASAATDDSLDLGRRRQWFLLDSQARRMVEIRIPVTERQDYQLSKRSNKRRRSFMIDSIDPSYRRRQWIQDLEQHRRKVAIVMQLEACVIRRYHEQTRTPTSSKLTLRLHSMSILLMSQKAQQETISKETIEELINILHQSRQKEADKATNHPDTDATDQLSETSNKRGRDAVAQDPTDVSLSEFIDQLVLVLDQVTFVADVVYMFDSVYREWFASFQRGLTQIMPLSPLIQSLQTRRETVRGLVESEKVNDFIPGVLYRLIDSCCAVQLDEWFDMFESHSRGTSGGDANFNFLSFVSGIYALQVMGLIKGERKTSGGRRIFEKAAIVWCGIES